MLIFANDMGKSKLSHRITWHVILIITIFNVLIIGAVILFDLRFSYRESEVRALNLMDAIGGKLMNMKKAVEIAAIHNVVETLIIAIILVILVVFFFLQNFKATIIPSISIVVSLLGTFAIVS